MLLNETFGVPSGRPQSGGQQLPQPATPTR